MCSALTPFILISALKYLEVIFISLFLLSAKVKSQECSHGLLFTFPPSLYPGYRISLSHSTEPILHKPRVLLVHEHSYSMIVCMWALTVIVITPQALWTRLLTKWVLILESLCPNKAIRCYKNWLFLWHTNML